MYRGAWRQTAFGAAHDPLTTAHSRRGVLIGTGAAAALVTGGGLFAWQQGLIGGDDASANSVAVVPFANFGGDPAQAISRTA